MVIFLLAVWLLRTLFAIPPMTYYWQLKEYRWDRMREFLCQQGGFQMFFSTFHILLTGLVVIAAIAWGIFSVESSDLSWYSAAVTTLLLAELVSSVHLLMQRKWKRPKKTFKALAIVVTTFVCEILILLLLGVITDFQVSEIFLATSVALLVLFEHDLNAAVVFAFNRVTDFLKRKQYKKAQSKRLSMKNLKVVGITGSFGKTSVKEYLYHLLEESFKVLKTEKNTNTEIGIAKTILQKLNKDHEVFVCEMGAYKIGEIKLCSLMAQPQIGIFTGLNEQHVALFGSIDNTFQAKWELISSLPENGAAIFNGDSKELKSRLITHKGKTIICSTQEGDALATNIQTRDDGISFEYNGHQFKSSLVGRFQAVNLLMAIVAAEQLGVPLNTLQERVKSIKAPEKTMEQQSFSKGVLLDDSYNVNTDGVKALLDHMSTFKDHRKILFFPGILELGDKMEQIHQEIGEEIGKHVDTVFFHDPSFYEYLERGALKGGMTRKDIHSEQQFEEIQSILDEMMKEDQRPLVVAFESRGAEKVMEWLKEL